MKSDQMGTRTAHPSPQELLLSNGTRFNCLLSEPVREKVESDEPVVILSLALLFRNCADVDSRDPPYLRP